MLELDVQSERLARLVAICSGRSTEAVIHAALEREARASGVIADGATRMTAEEMLAFGAKVAARPVLDQRSPKEIMDDINER